MTSRVDLHCHSTASDGTLPAAEVVRLAVDSGLSALALTDHDTIGGVAEAAAEAKRRSLDFLPGIEISAEYPHPGTMHLLGYGVDPASETLRDLTKTLLAGRDNRNPRIVEKLQSLKSRWYDCEFRGEPRGAVGVTAFDRRSPLPGARTKRRPQAAVAAPATTAASKTMAISCAWA